MVAVKLWKKIQNKLAIFYICGRARNMLPNLKMLNFPPASAQVKQLPQCCGGYKLP